MKKLSIAIVITAMFGAGLYLGMIKQNDKQLKLLMQDSVITVLGEPKALGEFSLRDHDGKVFDRSRLRGKWSLLFFGYTNCPDICPTTLATLNQLHSRLGKKANLVDDMQSIFVSVDPGRDEIKKLKKYVVYFNKDFIGITGSKEQLAKLAKQLGAYYEVLNKGGKKAYAVNHTAAIFIVNKDADYIGVMSPPHDTAAMALRIEMVKEL